MCSDIVCRWKCSPRHREREDGWGRNRDLKLKYIAKCFAASQNGQPACPPPREVVHEIGEDDEEEVCPECRGETPPETP